MCIGSDILTSGSDIRNLDQRMHIDSMSMNIGPGTRICNGGFHILEPMQ